MCGHSVIPKGDSTVVPFNADLEISGDGDVLRDKSDQYVVQSL